MIDTSLLIKCANTLKKVSRLKTFEPATQKELATCLTLLKSLKTQASGQPVRVGLLEETIGMVETSQKLIKRGDKASLFLTRQQLSTASTRCRVVADLK